MAKLIGELNILRPQMHGEHDYEGLKKKYASFLAFRAADKDPNLKVLFCNIRDHRRHIRLAQQMAGAHHGRQLNTIKTDWKKRKPEKFRSKRT